MSRTSRALAAALALAAPSLAAAHDFWIERSGDGFVLRYGHRGGEVLPIDTAKVKTLLCAAGGSAPKNVLSSALLAPSEVRVTARCDAISAFYDGGFYSLTPDGEVNLPKNEAVNAVKAWESRQFAKWVDPRGAVAILGDELEIVPVSDLSRARRGDKVTLEVLLRGKPVAGAVVAVDHKPLGETDSAGEVRLRLRAAGVESIGASLRRQVSTPEADAQVFEASLTFEVAK